MAIHPTAIVHPKAKIGRNVEIGPYVFIDEHVKVGDGTRILHGVHLTGWTTIGRENEIHMGAVLGHDPQDRTFKKGDRSYLVVGDRNIIREYTTIHRGAKPESRTVVGNGNLFMGLCHIAHNCEIGDGVVIGNGTLLAGYVTVEDKAFISGNCGIHQFVRIGTLAMIGGLSMVTVDVPPYVLVDCETSAVGSVNQVGLRRSGLSDSVRQEIREAFHYLYRRGLNTTHALQEIERRCKSPELKHLIEFIRGSKRGIGRMKRFTLTQKREPGILNSVEHPF